MNTFQSTLEHSDTLSNQGSALGIYVTRARQLPCSLKGICRIKKSVCFFCLYFFQASTTERSKAHAICIWRQVTFLTGPLDPPSGCDSACGGSLTVQQAAQLEHQPMIESAGDETSCDHQLPCVRKSATGRARNNSPCPPTGLLCGRWPPTTSPSVCAIFRRQHVSGSLFFHLVIFPFGEDLSTNGPEFTANLPGASDATRCQSRQRGMTVAHRDAVEERGNDETTLGCHETELTTLTAWGLLGIL